MNYFIYGKLGYMDKVLKFSDEEINLERKKICNFFNEITNRFQKVIQNIKTIIIPELEKIKRKGNITERSKSFKRFLENFFNECLKEKEELHDKFLFYSNTVCDDTNCDREKCIEIIENTFDKITEKNGTGIYDKLLYLLDLIMYQGAIVMYKLYNVCLIDEEELKTFLNAPKVMFGGLNKKGKPDVKYTLKKYEDLLKFDVDYIENSEDYEENDDLDINLNKVNTIENKEFAKELYKIIDDLIDKDDIMDF